MNMKKLFFLMLLVVLALSLMGGMALAGGWSNIQETTHSPDTGYWETGAGNSPHGNFGSSTNQCRVCHAVHMAGANSWRLLNNGVTGGTSRATECDYCHGATGATVKRPYGQKTYTVYGEHTIGATAIPDSSNSASIGGGGLSCGNCHSVHGANTIDEGTDYSGKILKLDPNSGLGENNGVLAASAVGAADDTSTDERLISNFCADCHDANPNWDENAADDGSEDGGRPNGRSHVQGEAGNGQMEVYDSTVQVAGWGTGETSQTTTNGCRDCHAATSAGNSVAGTADTSSASSAFPHQTKGAKLLFDDITTGTVQQTAYMANSGSSTNDADRVIPQMDKVCGKCHTENGDFTGDGVGSTF